MSLNKTKNLITGLPKTDVLTLDDTAKVEEARNEYNALTSEEKKEIPDISVLTDAETQISVLKEITELAKKAEASISSAKLRAVRELYMSLKDGQAKKSFEIKIKKLESRLRFVSGIFWSLILAGILILIFTVLKYSNTERSYSHIGVKNSHADFQNKSQTFLQGEQYYNAGKYEQAIAMFEKSRESASTWGENAIIDFSIAGPAFMLDKKDGIQKLIDISKNQSYDNETRALAMIRAFLLYSKYFDSDILAQLMAAYNIPAGTRREITKTYMEKVYATYPFAYPAIYIVGYKLSTIKNKDEATALYNQYLPVIDNDIHDMKLRTSRAAELTSTMLAKAKLLSRLYLEFGAFTKTDVEKAFQDLITYDQERGGDYNANKEYALIEYANFMSGAKDYGKAEKILQILFSEPLNPALKEALPKLDLNYSYVYFPDLQKNTQNEDVKKFLNFIGSDISKQETVEASSSVQ